MDAILDLLRDPGAWAALVTLIVKEVVLGIDNLIFISILSNVMLLAAIRSPTSSTRIRASSCWRSASS